MWSYHTLVRVNTPLKAKYSIIYLHGLDGIPDFSIPRLFYPRTFLSQDFSILTFLSQNGNLVTFLSQQKYDNIMGNTLLTIVYVNQKYEFICCI